MSDGGRDGDIPKPVDLWVRWDRDVDEHKVRGDTMLSFNDPQIHRFCDIWPLDLIRKGDVKNESPDVKFVDGITRLGLRYTPQIIGLVIIALLVAAELSPEVYGVSAFIPQLSGYHYLAGAGLGILWLVIGWLVVNAGMIGLAEAIRAGIVYSVLAILSVGTAFSVYQVLRTPDPTVLSPNIIYVSGYLLMLFIGGLLVYDGMLKTENLLGNLASKNIVRESQKSRYHEFKANVLNENLNMRNSFPGTDRAVKTRNILATLFVLQFGAGWWISHGPQNLDFWVTLVLNVAFDIFVVIVAFQFLMLIASLNDLLNARHREKFAGETDILKTVPFHTDGYGGFRDLGQFATRVNILLILAGFYLVYRLYVQGSRVAPDAMIPGADPLLSVLLWGISFAGPVIAYLIVAIAWYYFSFYQMHSKMAYDRENDYIQHKIEQRKSEQGETLITSSRTLGEIQDGRDWIDLRDSAPVWPVNNRRLKSLISGTFAPILFSIPRFLF